ncbi:MAG: class I SAM-dependent methyltransferase [Candidatus Zixiibacteriota bacterium]
MDENRLYDDLAHLYPLIAGPEAYAREAEVWKQILREKLGPGRHRILELGVGGGFNLSHFTAEYDAVAVDLSPKMVANSMRLNPDVPHSVGDMRTVRLNQTFKAVLIHDAICYLTTEDDLRQTFETVNLHLETGGVVIAAPDWYKETFIDGQVRHNTMRAGDTLLTHIEYEYDSDPDDTKNDMILLYFIRQGKALRIEQDHHILGLFPAETWLRIIKACGFIVERRLCCVHEDGREAWALVGVKTG